MTDTVKQPAALQGQQSLGLIYARSRNHCIGVAGRIPWHLPADFAHFKQTTIGKPIIMGRRTYEDHQSALPGRLNIVVTGQRDYQAAHGIVLAHSLDEALTLGWQQSASVFVIGGVQFFVAAMPIADVVYETVVDIDIDPDNKLDEKDKAILPAFDFSNWQSTLMHEHQVDERHAHSFSVYRRERPANN
ncbi:MAG: dihydrofolate reductase [Gammaproteobacteria bacterium]|nr:dihydrofolate reductase [Gammaproteobacteria bacterium]NND39696.1 dihydrofolate reductase [Pseudomonadales bacterium]MBT8150104.1 dihydrofolate reductase [Gammaproteobacteria bacterium]NNL10566.1 dihydrofolate reductase [Pseudomonadales bacterium]NNM12458.1 dihydrofolate reductase [Pseudomonadales bacterium]